MMFSKGLFLGVIKSLDCMVKGSLFPKQQILDSSKLKAFADDNFKNDENSRSSPND